MIKHQQFWEYDGYQLKLPNKDFFSSSGKKMAKHHGYLDHMSPRQKLWFIFGTIVAVLSAIPAPSKQKSPTTVVEIKSFISVVPSQKLSIC
jgi:hypothetical protein